MSNKEILEKAIQKAIDGGWKGFSYEKGTYTGPDPEWFLATEYYDDTKEFADVRTGVECSVHRLIFSHDFAKALWGEGQLGMDYKQLNGEDSYYEGSAEGMGYEMPAYRHHLQQMVIAQDPIAYLGEHL